MSILAISKKDNFSKSQVVSKETYKQFSDMSKVLSSEENAKGLEYVPIKLYISLRLIHSDDVIVNQEGVAIFEITPEIFNDDGDLYNFILMGGRKCVLEVFSKVEEKDLLKLVFSTQCVPIGATYIQEPIVLAHILLNNDIDSYTVALNSGYSFKPIESLVPLDILQESLYNKLIILGGEKDE